MSRSVWKRLEGFVNALESFQAEIQDLVSINLEYDGLDTWPTLFYITTWWMWRWRCMFVFGRGNEVPLVVGAFLKVSFDETWRSFHDDIEIHDLQPPKKPERLITWMSPPQGWYALNSNGVVCGRLEREEAGVVIRNNNGTFISAFGYEFWEVFNFPR